MDQRSGILFPVGVVTPLPATSNTVLVPKHPAIQWTLESGSPTFKAAKVLMTAFVFQRGRKL